jgi:hypothetical protein
MKLDSDVVHFQLCLHKLWTHTHVVVVVTTTAAAAVVFVVIIAAVI